MSDQKTDNKYIFDTAPVCLNSKVAVADFTTGFLFGALSGIHPHSGGIPADHGAAGNSVRMLGRIFNSGRRFFCFFCIAAVTCQQA